MICWRDIYIHVNIQFDLSISNWHLQKKMPEGLSVFLVPPSLDLYVSDCVDENRQVESMNVANNFSYSLL